MSNSLVRIESRGTFFSILLVIFFLIIYAFVFDTKIDLSGDNAYYFMLGKALSQGEGYINLNSINKTPNNHFPPGYPALIAVILLFISKSILAVKLANGLFFMLTVLMTYSFTRITTNRAVVSALAALFILLNAHFLKYSTIMMTEVPFTFFSFFTILLFFKTDFSKPVLKNPFFYYSLISLVIAYYIRSLGVAILGGMVLYLLFEKKWWYALSYIVGTVALAVPWVLRGQSLGGNSYVRQLLMVNPYRPELGTIEIGDIFSRIFINLQRYITFEIPASIFSFFEPDYRSGPGFTLWLIGVFIVLLIAIGFWRLKRFKWFVVGYALSTFVVLLVWPEVWIGTRFILPLVPVLLGGFLNGLRYIIKWISHRTRSRFSVSVWILAVGLAFYFPGVNQLRISSGEDYERNWQNYFQTARIVKLMDNPNLVVACRKPVLFYLESGTYTTNYKYTQDDQALLQDLEEREVDYVVIDQLGYSTTYRYLYPAVEKNRDRFEVIEVVSNPDTYLLKFNSVE